jgi:dTDP-4-dehydrorhamnose 3,5-epimerase
MPEKGVAEKVPCEPPYPHPLEALNRIWTFVSENLPPNCRLHRLDIRGDHRGSLVAIEGGRGATFPIERVYYIFGNHPDVERGFHAHANLTQLAVCVSGSCTMTLDDGYRRVDVRLDRPDLAVEIGSLIWREMRDFSPDAVLLVLASARYDTNDYIRDYGEFLKRARG